MILEELKESNSVLFDLNLNLIEQLVQFTLPDVADSIRLVHSFCSNVFYLPFVWVGISQELLVFNLVLFVSIGLDKRLQFLITHSQAEVSEDLSELLGGYFEVLVVVEVLEETLRIQPGSQQ